MQGSNQLGIMIILMIAAGLGCMNQPGMDVPSGWQTVAAVAPDHPDTPDTQTDRTVTDLPVTKGNLLQVVICYGWVVSNHTCVRLEGPGNHVLFWDPGGLYGEADQPSYRHHDLLLDEHALSLQELWDYRRVGCNEPMMLVFQWQLSAAQAQANRALLIQGRSENDDPSTTFDPDAPGGACAVYVSRFLQRYCTPSLGLERSWFWPHNLARRLWQASPDRVWLFKRDQPVRVVQRSSQKPSS